MENLRICFAGTSGTGKTTLAKYFRTELKVPFLTGSYTALVEGEQGKTHQDILKETDHTELVMKEWQLLNRRVRDYRANPKFISDRSLLDSATYGTFKLAKDLSKCDVEDFITTCLQMQSKYSSHLIYLPYGIEDYDTWKFEDNDKRITNPWFQLQVGNLMEDIFSQWVKSPYLVSSNDIGPLEYQEYGVAVVYHLTVDNHDLKVLRLKTWDKETRFKIIQRFLNMK